MNESYILLNGRTKNLTSIQEHKVPTKSEIPEKSLTNATNSIAICTSP